jgi:F-type H+-transporting ATPase subunit delta
VFQGERWAAAFVNALGENAEAGLACLKALVPPVQAIPGALFGRSAAGQLEKLMGESVVAANGVAEKYAIRFISLLVEKNLFKHIDSLVRRIEKRLDDQKGILDITAESAVPLDAAFEEELRRLVQERTGAAEIKMRTRLAPELLGGYRLRIGGFYIDASLKGQLEQMTADLARPLRGCEGACNGEL